ncbi:MAG: cytochrome P450, partial [Nannocystaceae bacterium]
FLLEGGEHKRERKLLMPPFHGERMRAYGEIIVETTLRHFQAAATQDAVKTIDVAQAISLEVIIRAIFGVQDTQGTEAFKEAVRGLTKAINPVFFFASFTQQPFFGIGPYDKFVRAYERLDNLLQKQITHSRARETPGEDILSLLVQARYEDGAAMEDASIRDELRTLLFAGHESTALTISWVIDLIHRTPGVLGRTLSELDALGKTPTPEQIAAAPYLEAACKEAMRLYPITTEVPRQLQKPIRLGNYSMPIGTAVSASILLVHYREDLYPEPNAFKPERFLDRRYSAFEYMPFGGGMRRCIGAAFAMYELKLVTATLLKHFNVDLLDSEAPVPVRKNITLSPKGGVPIRVRSP